MSTESPTPSSGSTDSRPRRRRLPTWRLLVYIGLGLGVLVMMIPFLYTISTALKSNAFVFTPEFFPRNPTLENFQTAWNSNNFQRYFLNSLKVATLSSLLTVVVATTQAYAFARMQFPGKNLIFNTYLITMMIPSMLFIIPQFLQARELGLLNSHLGLIVFYVVGSIPFQTFLLRSEVSLMMVWAQVNSSQLPRKEKIIEVPTAGPANGSTTRAKVVKRPAPST